MSRSSADRPKGPGQVDVYWRRRVIALAAGIGMLALVTWTVNGALGGGAPQQTTDLSQTTSHHSTYPAPATASATPGAAAGSATPTPSPAGKPTPSPSTSAKHATSAKHGASTTRHRARQSGQKTPATRGSAACPHADLVLSLSSARYSYPAHARAQFSVDVVSTAPGRCTAALGATHLHLVIRAGGKNQVWDSADCARPAPGATTLARGVPVVVPVTWNRQTSAPGCKGPRRAARPGTYTATAYSGKLGSRAIIFVLKGHGIAVP
jgi:hypothetical protein